MSECKEKSKCKCEEYKKKIAVLERCITDLMHKNTDTIFHYMKILNDIAAFNENFAKELYKIDHQHHDAYKFDEMIDNSKLGVHFE